MPFASGDRREDRDPAACGVEDAPQLAQDRHGIGEEEERLDRGDRRELAVGERERIGLGVLDADAALRPGQADHLPAVIDARGAATGLERPAQEDPAPAADVEQVVVRPERERLEQRIPEERVRIVGAVGRACLAAARPPREPVGHPVDPPVADALGEAHGPN